MARTRFKLHIHYLIELVSTPLLPLITGLFVENLQHPKGPVPLYIFRQIAPHRRRRGIAISQPVAPTCRTNRKRERKASHERRGFCLPRGEHIIGNARNRPESLMRHGERLAHKLQMAVAALDERFRNVTTEHDTWRSTSWWYRRQPCS